MTQSVKNQTTGSKPTTQKPAAGKDIVMPDYINYKGKRIPVTEMRGDIFWGKPIKSIKLPSTLTEISNAALRERKPYLSVHQALRGHSMS